MLFTFSPRRQQPIIYLELAALRVLSFRGPRTHLSSWWGVSIAMGDPQNGWFIISIMENPIKIDDLGLPLFQETTILTVAYMVFHRKNGFTRRNVKHCETLSILVTFVGGPLKKGSPFLQSISPAIWVAGFIEILIPGTGQNNQHSIHGQDWLIN